MQEPADEIRDRPVRGERGDGDRDRNDVLRISRSGTQPELLQLAVQVRRRDPATFSGTGEGGIHKESGKCFAGVLSFGVESWTIDAHI